MHLQRAIKIQLVVFLIIAVIATGILIFGYGRVGDSLFGWGRYTVTVDLPETAGLYGRANVTYQGTTVGRVSEVSLTNSGVRAQLSLNTAVAIPSDLTAEVHSQSAVGEQFIALAPRDPRSRPLRAGDVITAAHTTVPPDIGQQLDMTATALNAIPKDNLKTVIDESYTAVGGLGPDLARILDASLNIATDTRTKLDDLTTLIDHSGPILESQIRTRDEIIDWATHLATVTGQLQRHNAHVSGLLHNGAPAADQARALFERLNPTLPIVLANLVGLANIGVVYNPNIEQMLVLMPQILSQLGASATTNLDSTSEYRGSTEQAMLNLNVPQSCLTGYLPPRQWRPPSFEDAPERPSGDFYCRVPQNSPVDVRGARNIPCEGKPWMRAPLVWMCETNTPYVPLNDGNNWKGDPNATTTGQDVPQMAPGAHASTPTGQVPVSADGRPPIATPPAALSIADYNPVDGTYLGPDGQIYTQSNLVAGATLPTLKAMLLPGAPLAKEQP